MLFIKTCTIMKHENEGPIDIAKSEVPGIEY